MVYFTSSKEMFQNTEEFVQKGTYKTVCHGTSVNVICYMAQQRKQRTQYGNKSCYNFTLPSPQPQSHCVHMQWRSLANRGPYHCSITIFFFAQILLTCDPRVTNASTRERIRGTFQTSLYRQEKRGVGAKGWSVKFRLSLGDFLYDSLSFI